MHRTLGSQPGGNILLLMVLRAVLFATMSALLFLQQY